MWQHVDRESLLSESVHLDLCAVTLIWRGILPHIFYNAMALHTVFCMFCLMFFERFDVSSVASRLWCHLNHFSHFDYKCFNCQRTAFMRSTDIIQLLKVWASFDRSCTHSLTADYGAQLFVVVILFWSQMKLKARRKMR